MNFWKDIYIKSIESLEPSYVMDWDQWRRTSRGTAILGSRRDCYIYNKYYADRHYAVLNNQMNKLFNMNNRLQNNDLKMNSYKNIYINDYGCGQGIAAFSFIEKTIKNGHFYDEIKINLIDPSNEALNLAEIFIERLILENKENICKRYKINKIVNTLDNLNEESCFQSDISNDESSIKIHIFSNILDVFSVDIQKLAADIKQQFSGINIFMSNSPPYEGSNKIISFYDLYRHESIIEEIGQYYVSFRGYYFQVNRRTESTIKTKSYRGTIFISRLDKK